MIVGALCLGLLVGYFAKGITININHTHKHEQPEPKKEEQKYNPSMVGYLPAEVQQYYQQTNGQNRF
jgi:cell division protein FtsN